MSSLSPGLYAQWRARIWAAHTLGERPPGWPLHERLLQLIWHHQRLRRDELQTTGGQRVRVLHPGFWNHEAGPDFRGAIIQFGDALARNGDVEVDLSSQNWQAHHHDRNPAYKNVILHVVWQAQPPDAHDLPTVAVHASLDASLEELSVSLGRETSHALAGAPGRCAAFLRELNVEQWTDLLRQAAGTRLETKASQLQARAKQVGWERSLWEGLFGALGYKNNIWPMRRISEVLPNLVAGLAPRASALALQARLLGVSGLLPSEVTQHPAGAACYLRGLWNLWWREREQFGDVALPRSLWRLNNLRPANNPQRRLALAAHWLAESDLPARLERWFAAAKADSKLPQSLLEVLQITEDDFWSRHWTFRSAPFPEPQPLIGPQRVTDLAINVILPWFWIRAALGQNDHLQRLAEECYFAWPKSEDNAVLRLARRRLFGDGKIRLNTAALQQGLLQIVRDFCDRSNALCENCEFPAVVKAVVSGE